jgi:hypothetical protein
MNASMVWAARSASDGLVAALRDSSLRVIDLDDPRSG